MVKKDKPKKSHYSRSQRSRRKKAKKADKKKSSTPKSKSSTIIKTKPTMSSDRKSSPKPEKAKRKVKVKKPKAPSAEIKEKSKSVSFEAVKPEIMVKADKQKENQVVQDENEAEKKRKSNKEKELSKPEISLEPSIGRIRLDEQLWFHDQIPRKLGESELKEDGDWLLRAAKGTNRMDIVLTVLWNNNPRHYLLVNDIEGVCLKGSRTPHFHRLLDMLAYYEKNRISSDGTRLVRAIERKKCVILSRWIIRSANIGAGYFGQVCHVTVHKPDTQISCVVAKGIKRDLTEKERTQLIDRMSQMTTFNHTNLVHYFGIVADKPPIAVILENCEQGSLLECLRRRNSGFSFQEKISYAHQAAEGMRYLSLVMNFIHGNIAARNCMVTKGDVVKISDYGIITWPSSSLERCLSGRYAQAFVISDHWPIKWMAPEILKTGVQFSINSDVWSFGVLLWEIWTEGQEPYCEVENRDCLKLIVSGGVQLSIPEDIPFELSQITRACWRTEPFRRPTFGRIANYLEIADDSMTQTFSQR